VGSRRGHGEGSIYQRESDGRWVTAIDLGYVNGKRKRTTIYGRTRREVAEKLAQALRDQQQGLLVPAKRQTVGEFLDSWLEARKPALRPKTHVSYAGIVAIHLKPAIGHHQLAKLTPQHVQRMLNDKLASGLSPRSVQYLRDVLRNALGQAVRWNLMPRNVAALVEPPRVPQYEMRFLTPEQARRLLDHAKGDRLEALYTVALALGLRQGEALGLRWRDIDFTAGTLRVHKALQRVEGRLQLVDPKTLRSRRTLAMPATVSAALAAHRRRQARERALAGDRWDEREFVFTTSRGGPLDGRNVTRSFKRLLAAAELPDLRWHDLRHSCASLLLAQGVPYRVIMDVLGHSQISQTMRYSHVLPELSAEAARSMDRILGDSSESAG
jgi:integrase